MAQNRTCAVPPAASRYLLPALRDAFCTHWERLTTRPPSERRYTSLKTMMYDRFVVAASPLYLRAVESDLLAGRKALCNPEQLAVVTSKAYQG